LFHRASLRGGGGGIRGPLNVVIVGFRGGGGVLRFFVGFFLLLLLLSLFASAFFGIESGASLFALALGASKLLLLLILFNLRRVLANVRAQLVTHVDVRHRPARLAL